MDKDDMRAYLMLHNIPTHDELIRMYKQNNRRSSFLQKIRCFFGFHNWQTVSKAKCTVTAMGLFTDLYKTNALSKILKCPCCGLCRGVVTDGATISEMDVDYLLESSGGRLHL